MATDTTSRQLVVFTLAGESYGLPITDVHEIIRYAEPRPVSSSDPSLRGVISLRGKIVPVYELGPRLGLAGADADADTERSKIVIVDFSSELVGVLVDDVDEVLTVEDTQLEEVPAMGAASPQTIAKLDERLVIVLSPTGIWGDAPPPDLALAA